MLKGTLDVGMDFMEGSIIFGALSIILITSLVSPLITFTVENVEVSNDIKTIKFAALVKHKLETELTGRYGGIQTNLLDSASESDLTAFGLFPNYVYVRDVSTDREWEFPGDDGRLRHTTFSTVSSYYTPMTSGTIMERGEAYVVHLYKAGENTAVDIYSEPICSVTETLTERGRLDCSEFLGLMPERLEASAVRDYIISVKNSQDDDAMLKKLIIAGEDITIDEVKPSGTDIEEECLEGRNRMCFRIIERYTHPAEISIEIDHDSPILIYRPEFEGFGGGGEMGGGGGGGRF